VVSPWSYGRRIWLTRWRRNLPGRSLFLIACDGDFDDCATTPAWLGATDVLLNADHRATYALIHNYRGDVVGLENGPTSRLQTASPSLL
jgi:hypothetical protein